MNALRAVRASQLGAGAIAAAIGAATAGTYDLTVDPVTIETGNFSRSGIGFNGASPGPVLRFREGEEVTSTSPTTSPRRPRCTGTA